MAEAVILSAIESMEDCWLLKQPNLWEENVEKLYSLIVGMSDFGEDNKQMLHNLMFEMADLRMYTNWKSSKEKLYNLVDWREDKKQKMYRLVVGMADFWEHDKGMLYCLLLRVVTNPRENTPDQIYNLAVEIADLWGDDEGELNKEKLHSLLSKMTNNITNNIPSFFNRKRYTREMCMISVEMVELWEDNQPKLNKEKLYTWLANRDEYLLSSLLLMVGRRHETDDIHNSTRETVEDVRRCFRWILDFITDKKLGEESSLRYFISDVVDMAHQAQVFVQLLDSDPYALFLEFLLLRCRDFSYDTSWLLKKLKHILNGLLEIKVSMLEFGVTELNFGDLEGGEIVVGLEKDVKLLLQSTGSTTIIWGMGGIGKTTLYNHTTITEQFERRAWVCLSNLFSRKEILVSLIRQVETARNLRHLRKRTTIASHKRFANICREHDIS